MRQKKFALNNVIARLNKAKRRFRLMIAEEADDEVLLRCYLRVRAARVDVQKVCARSHNISMTVFNLNAYSEEECYRNFRFRAKDIGKIVQLCGWNSGKTKRCGYVVDPITATCLVLRKLSFPTRWKDIENMFGMHAPAMSEVFYEVNESLVHGNRELLETFNAPLMQRRAAMYADAIKKRGALLDHCVGFIDCTRIEMARPGGRGVLQRSTYSGHKRIHCLIYQTITTPDGLMFYMHGPEVGRRHDMTLYRESGIGAVLEQALVIDGKQYCIYGDAAYMLRPWLQTAFPRVLATPQQVVYNTAMSAVREAVEWTYKDVKQMWTSQDFRRGLKVRKAPIALLYKASALLWNFHVCMYAGGQTKSYFDISPPKLAEYIGDQ